MRTRLVMMRVAEEDACVKPQCARQGRCQHPSAASFPSRWRQTLEVANGSQGHAKRQRRDAPALEVGTASVVRSETWGIRGRSGMSQIGGCRFALQVFVGVLLSVRHYKLATSTGDIVLLANKVPTCRLQLLMPPPDGVNGALWRC